MLKAIGASLGRLARDVSPVLAGFKLAAILLGYFGIGSIAKWIIEQWYPFTRWIWDNVFSYFNFPRILDVEKDSLTAMVFFLPLGITAVVSRLRRQQELANVQTKAISASLAILFVYAICANIIKFVISSTSLNSTTMVRFREAVSDIQDNSGLILLALSVNILGVIVFSTLITNAHRILKADRLSPYVKVVERAVEKIFDKRNREIYLKANRIAVLIMSLIMFILGILASLSLESYLPLVAIVVVVLSVAMSIFHTPKKLMVAAGSSLAFISAAYACELVLSAIDFIENPK